jgi:hypothetical protein
MGDAFGPLWDVWTRRRMFVSGQTGFAPCTEELKRMTAEMAQRPGDVIVLGYTAEEATRFARVRKRNPGETIEAPLIDKGLTKADCFGMLDRAGIALPAMYGLGFRNNNCIGCPRGGMGYWNNIRRHFPEVFARMAKLEREIGMAILHDGKGSDRIFLDELAPDRGDAATEPNIECSIMCHLAEQDASVDRSPEGQDAQRLDAKHESAVGSEASETPHTSQNTPKETSHD